MPDPVITQRTVHVEHIKIESAKPFAKVKAALEELVPPLDPAVPESLRQGDIGRAKEALQRGPELAIFGSRVMADCCALPASLAGPCSTTSAIH